MDYIHLILMIGTDLCQMLLLDLSCTGHVALAGVARHMEMAITRATALTVAPQTPPRAESTVGLFVYVCCRVVLVAAFALTGCAPIRG